MAKEKDGKFIYLDWEYEPGFYAVRGWVPEDDARAEIQRECGNQFGSPVEGWTMIHIYAAHLQTAMAKSEGWSSEVRIYNTPGPGRFKVSAFVEPDHEFLKAD